MSSLHRLPQDCLSIVLSWTSPVDACRLASVSRSFAAASRSNTTWLYLLPPDFPQTLSISNLHPKLLHSLRDYADKRQVFQCLSRGVLLQNGRQHYVLLKCGTHSGGVCRSLSVSAMSIAWGNDSRFWRWEPSKRSSFSKVAHLIAVCWLDVNGRWKCTLPPGQYSVCWHLKVVNPQGGQGHFLTWRRPLKFTLSYLGSYLEKELDLLHLPSNGYEKWFEFEVGKIDVKGSGRAPRCVVELELEFGIREVDCSFWKGGLFLDCIMVRPSYCNDMIHRAQSEKRVSNVRGRTGVF